MWNWPLENEIRTWPDGPGRFGAIRKYDIHTGIDLYCDEGTEVVAVEAGTLVTIEDFTGPKAGSEWWNDTQSILVHGESGVVCYGELAVSEGLEVGSLISRGQVLGTVKTVLKKDKGRPMTMLHLELYESWVRNSKVWKHTEDRPRGLLDPTLFLKEAFFPD